MRAIRTLAASAALLSLATPALAGPTFANLGSSSSGGGAITVANGADTAEGSTTDSAWSGSGAGTVVGILKAIYGTQSVTATTANATTGATLPGVGVLGFDGTNYRRLNTAGAIADGGSGSSTVVAANTYWNGASWDRARGDTTGGSYVQEKERSNYFAETSTALAANATFTGSARDAGTTPSQWTSFTCKFRADQASATNGAQLISSIDGTTYWIEQQATLVAGVATTLTSPVTERYHECKLINGATAQGSNFINSRFGAN